DTLLYIKSYGCIHSHIWQGKAGTIPHIFYCTQNSQSLYTLKYTHSNTHTHTHRHQHTHTHTHTPTHTLARSANETALILSLIIPLSLCAQADSAGLSLS